MTVFVMVLLCAVGLLGFIPQYQKYVRHEEQLSKLRDDKSEVEQRLQRLRVKQERFLTERDYVKTVAHEMGMVQPGEMVFRFYDEAEGHLPRRGQ